MKSKMGRPEKKPEERVKRYVIYLDPECVKHIMLLMGWGDMKASRAVRYALKTSVSHTNFGDY